jgi:hypothetical protein
MLKFMAQTYKFRGNFNLFFKKMPLTTIIQVQVTKTKRKGGWRKMNAIKKAWDEKLAYKHELYTLKNKM